MGMDLADMEQRVTELNELSNIYSLICSDNGSVLYQSAYLKMLQSQLRQEISYFLMISNMIQVKILTSLVWFFVW